MFIKDDISMIKNNKILEKTIYYMDLTNVASVLLKVVLSFFIFLGAYLAPIYAKGLAIFGFMIVDTITGIWASKKTGVPFRSGKLKRIVSKFISYGIALVVALVFTEEFGADILTVVAFGLASLEVTSIFENLYKITHINFLKWITDKLRSEREKFEERRIEKKKDSTDTVEK